ncbi:unnamed protein product [Effrenium voratum]|uniref:Uncharacterized protein n=1 Tax=Effrenium voratum TaxID=2562239 RepID=A0AA36MS52_9DINO|nr:unnamed protein product [Effrenium voratum]
MAPKAKGASQPSDRPRSPARTEASKSSPPKSPRAAQLPEAKEAEIAPASARTGASHRKSLLDQIEPLPGKALAEPSTPKLLRRCRSTTPVRPKGPTTFRGLLQDNETVAGWVEHDTRIRCTMPLNPAAEEEEDRGPLPVHPAAEAAKQRGKKQRGVKRYAGIGAQASNVDQIIFGRDMDYSQGDGGDQAAYAGRAGVSSQAHVKAGGVKKVEMTQRETLVHSPYGVTSDEKEPERRCESSPLSPNCSPGMAEVFGNEPVNEDKVEAARLACFGDAAGTRSWKSSPKPKREDGPRTPRSSGDLVSKVVFGGQGSVPEKESLADARKKRVDSSRAFVDLAGRNSAELNNTRGKRHVAWSESSGSAGCPSGSLGDHQAGWHPEARDRLVKMAAGFEEPHCAMRCVSGKVLNGQATPRQEALWAERKANIHREVPGKKHLGVGMASAASQADIFGRSSTPPSGFGTPRHSNSLFEGSAGKPSTFAEWDLPRPSRSMTPPRNLRFADLGKTDVLGRPVLHGIPSWSRGATSTILEGGDRRIRGVSDRPHPTFGRSNVGCLLNGE